MGVSTSPATGARGAVRAGEEAVYGVPVAPTHVIDFTSESITATENIIESESIREDRGRHKLIRGNLDITGDVSFEQSASGYGLLIRHALGDYVLLKGADGGIRGRVRRASQTINKTSGVTLGASDAYVLPLADEYVGGFGGAGVGGLVGIVSRDANDALQSDNNTPTGFAYDEGNGSEKTYIVDIETGNTEHAGTTAATACQLAKVLDADGNLVAPDFNTVGGICFIGNDRVEYLYFEYTAAHTGTFANGEPVLWLHPDSTTANGNPDDAGGAPDHTHDVGIVGWPALVRDGGSTWTSETAPVGAEFDQLGAFVYEYSNAWETANVYTHHLERGTRLPTGLTIEVDRDAAIFIYAGCKISTMALTFDANAIVTGTFGVLGRQEFAMADLVEDVVPGQTEIYVDADEMFVATGGSLTIGEETNITYTTVASLPNGTFTISGIPASGANSISRFHPKGSNVDGRTSTEAATTYSGDNSPLTAFETIVYIDGDFEEVLSGSINLDNGLNGDKFGLGSRFRLQLVEELATVEASLTMEFDDGKNYKKFIDGEFFALEFRAISEADDSEIGTTGVLAAAYYFMPKCKFTGTTPVIAGTSFITHDMPVTCVVDDDLDTTDLVVVLVNDNLKDVDVNQT